MNNVFRKNEETNMFKILSLNEIYNERYVNELLIWFIWYKVVDK